MDTGIRYLSGADVERAMPSVSEGLDLAERALIALVEDAELPPKIGLHPRPDGSFAHAMPASLRPRGAADPADDLLGIKWVLGFPGNRAAGLAPINAVVILNDPTTGMPVAIMDGGPITARRTAAVSGVVIRHFGPTGAGRVPRVAMIGAGVQGNSHVEMLAHVLPGAQFAIHDRHPERAAALASYAGDLPGGTEVSEATVAPSAREAAAAADIVITAVTFARPEDRQPMTPDWLAPDALLVAVDYAAMCAASTASDAVLFLVDDRGQFLMNRDLGQFDGYPDPTATIGEALLARTVRPPAGRVVATPLGVGLADLVFANAILQRARDAGIGTLLPR